MRVVLCVFVYVCVWGGVYCVMCVCVLCVCVSVCVCGQDFFFFFFGIPEWFR